MLRIQRAMSSSTTVPNTFATNLLKVKPESIHFDLKNNGDSQVPRITDDETEANIKLAAKELLTTNNAIGFPTETVYGLAGSALSDESVKSIYRAKQRPADNPLIIHVSSLSQLQRKLLPANYEIPKIYHNLIEHFWPGPLTILLPNNSSNSNSDSNSNSNSISSSSNNKSPISSYVTANQDTFAVRMPAHPVARALIAISDLPLAAPSANSSTKPSPTLAQHVMHDLGGKIPIVLDGGACDVGVESTVVDGLSDPPMLLRPGGVSLEELKRVGGEEWKNVRVAKRTAGADELVKTPGMKYKHYSPDAKVVLFVNCGDGEEAIAKYLKANRVSVDGVEVGARGDLRDSKDSKQEGQGQKHLISANADTPKVALLKSRHFRDYKGIDVVRDLGSAGDDIARNLFKYLREVDEDEKVDLILIEGVEEVDEGLAIMNRLKKAAFEVIEG